MFVFLLNHLVLWQLLDWDRSIVWRYYSISIIQQPSIVVWSHSSHTKRVDVTINNCLRTITGCIRSTPVPWLSVLAYIQPPYIRRNAALARESRKIFENPDLPIHDDLRERHGTRFRLTRLTNSYLVQDPNVRLSGFESDRKNWTQLNRIRSNHGRCNETLNKWNPDITTMCDCGHHTQTIYHVNECGNRSYDGGIEKIFLLDEDDENAIQWLNGLDIILWFQLKFLKIFVFCSVICFWF